MKKVFDIYERSIREPDEFLGRASLSARLAQNNKKQFLTPRINFP